MGLLKIIHSQCWLKKTGVLQPLTAFQRRFFGSRPAFLRFLGFLGKDDLLSRMKTAARIDS